MANPDRNLTDGASECANESHFWTSANLKTGLKFRFRIEQSVPDAGFGVLLNTGK